MSEVGAGAHGSSVEGVLLCEDKAWKTNRSLFGLPLFGVLILMTGVCFSADHCGIQRLVFWAIGMAKMAWSICLRVS